MQSSAAAAKVSLSTQPRLRNHICYVILYTKLPPNDNSEVPQFQGCGDRLVQPAKAPCLPLCLAK